MLKTIGLALATFFLVFTLCVPLTYAIPMVIGERNSIFFENAEVLVDNDNNGRVSIGDTFWGIINVHVMKAPVDITGQFGPEIYSGGSPEYTGYFATDVMNILPPFTIPGEANPVIVLGPAAVDPKSILNVAGGEVIRIFEDPADNYNNSTQASGFTTATDGNPIWSLGIGPSTDGDSPGGYWYTLAPVLPPGVGNDVGDSFAGLNFISPLGDLYDVVNDPSENWQNLNVEMWFNSEIFQAALITDTTYFHFGSNDPAVYKPVPEPATMLLLGSGLIGLAGFGRKKKFFKKG